MALTKSILTGRVVLPTDAAPINAELVFTLSGLDSEGGDILPPGDPARCVLIDGELPAGYAIWRNTEGYRGTHYIVTVMWTDMTRQGIRETIRELGRIQVGDDASYVLADLLAEGTVPAGETFWSAITEAEYQAVLDAADRAEAAAADLIDVSGYKPRASEPIHASFKIQKDGIWYSPDWLIQVGAGQSNRLGNANATNGSKTGASTGNVFAWNGTAIVQATLGSLPFNTAAGQVNNIDFHEAHRISSETGRPVLIILHAIPGTSIGTWLPPYAGNSFTPGVNWTGLVNKIAAALAAGSAVLWGKNTIDVFGWSQGEDEYNLVPLYTLSNDRYPALLSGVFSASWAGAEMQFIATECLPQASGGTAYAVNEEWAKIMASGAWPRVSVASGAGLVTTGADTGQIVHYSGASLQQLGYRSADIYLGRDDGVTSGAAFVASDAAGGLVWKNRQYTRLLDLIFDPSNTYNQPITIGTVISGVPVVFEVDGTRSEVVSSPTASVYTINSASNSNVTVWYPSDAMRDQPPQFSINMAAGQGKLRSFKIGESASLSQVFLAGHESLQHCVDPKTWPREIETFRINGSPLVVFDSFIAPDMPKPLTLLSFTSTTPVPGLVRAAIDAENTARGGAISVTYSGLYASENFRRLRPEDFGASGLGVINDGAAMARFTAWGRTLELTPGANYRITAKQVMNLPAGAVLEGNGASITLEYTDTSDGLSFAAGAGAIIQNVVFRFPENAATPGLAYYQERMLGLSTGAKLINCQFIAAAPQPVSADDTRDGMVRVLGEDVVIDGCSFYNVYRCIQMTLDASTARSRVSNTRFDNYAKGVDTGSTMTNGVLENLTFGNPSTSALPNPGVNSITEGSANLTVRGIRVEGSGEHGVYLSSDTYTSGLVMTDVQVRGSGQCSLKLRRQTDFILADIHGFDTSDGNTPGTNEDVLRLECCRNGRVIGVSSGEVTANGGYEGIYIDACSDIDFFDVLLRGTSADFIYITDVNGPAEASPPTLGNLRFWGVRCFAPGAVPLLNIQATGAVGPIHVDGVDYRNATGSAVITNIGGAATDIVVKGNISTSGTMHTNTAGGAAVQIEAFWDRYVGGALQRSYVDGRFTMYGSQFDLADADTINFFARTTGTAGSGVYIGGFGGAQINSGRPGWALVGKQGTADPDQVGAAVLVHGSSASSDTLVETALFHPNGFTYLTLPGPYANDSAAAAASPAVAIGQAYRVTGGTIVWRQV